MQYSLHRYATYLCNYIKTLCDNWIWTSTMLYLLWNYPSWKVAFRYWFFNQFMHWTMNKLNWKKCNSKSICFNSESSHSFLLVCERQFNFDRMFFLQWVWTNKIGTSWKEEPPKIYYWILDRACWHIFQYPSEVSVDVEQNQSIVFYQIEMDL